MKPSGLQFMLFEEVAVLRRLMFWGRWVYGIPGAEALPKWWRRAMVMSLSTIDDWDDGNVIHDHPQSC
jgi:hypothetical protein